MKKQIIITVIATLLISAGVVSAGTYIGKNIFTEGSLTVLGNARFLNEVFISDGNYLRIPVITTGNPNREDCSELSHVGRVVVRDYPGIGSPKLYVCTQTYENPEKIFEWMY